MPEEPKKGEIQGYMFVQLNCWNTCIYAWNRTKKPVFYTPLPYAGDGGWLCHNSNWMNWQIPYCYSKIEHTWIKHGWHRVTFMGDFRQNIETLAKKVGYTIDYES